MTSSDKTIGIFGGTFDPVHNGHLSIAQSFLNSKIIDSLWVFLSPHPPHKKEKEVASYSHRFNMLKTAFEPIEQVVVSDLELQLPKPSYTVQTIAHLQQKYPDYSFYLCIGKDSLLTFTSWYRWREIISSCQLLVAERPTEPFDKIDPELVDSIQFVDHNSIAISSTEIRDKIKLNQPVGHLIPSSVAAIIKKENLYRSP